MKKLPFLALAAGLGLAPVQAQQTETYTEAFDRFFTKINRTEASTKILYERVVPFARLDHFNSKVGAVDTSCASHFIQAYSELRRADFSPRAQFPVPVDSLEKMIAKQHPPAGQGKVYIGLIHARFNTIDTAAARRRLFFAPDSALSDNLSVAKPLYRQNQALVVSPLMEEFQGGSVAFVVHKEFLFDNTPAPLTKLQMDFGDGAGFREVRLNTPVSVRYTTGGEKVIRVLGTFADGSQLSAFAKINGAVRPAARASASHTPYMDVPISARINYNGLGTGVMRIYHAHADGVLRKPILIVDGFDPGNVRQFESHTNNLASFWDMLAYDRGHVGLMLIEKGYDLVLLDLPDGGGYIEKNAMVCIEAVNEINRRLQANGSREEIVVVGPSMGGQVTRFALAYMENHPGDERTNHGKHNCRLWISFDSPHQGANISIGAQAFMHFFGYVGGQEKAKKVWDNTINCVAANQMLVKQYNRYSSLLNFPSNNSTCSLTIRQNVPHPLFTNYYSALRQLGYPSQLRKIAVSNGSLNGTPTGSGCGEAIELDATMNIRVAKIQLFPSAGRCELFYGMFASSQWNYLWNLRTKLWVYADADPSLCSIDAAPGGTYNTFDQIEEAAGEIDMIQNTEKAIGSHSFMPITSVLDISGNMNYCTNISQRDLVAEGRIPFQSYWGPLGKNMGHITFDQHLVDWVFNEIETYTQGSREIELCGYQDYAVHLPNGTDPSTPVFWTCSDNLRIVSGQGSKEVRIQCMVQGEETWVQATVGSLTHTREHAEIDLPLSKKQLKKYHLTITERETPYLGFSGSVSGNKWIDGTFEMTESVEIRPGAVLTVSGSLHAAPAAKIIVHPGGKLIVDGGVITNLCGTEPWQGIELHGDPQDQAQNPSMQGVVQLENGAVIENAITGVMVGSSSQQENRGGGILQVSNASFVNCHAGVEFKPYSRIAPNGSEMPNKSSFSDCLFVWNGDMVDSSVDAVPRTHVKLSGVGMVLFQGCSFLNQRFPGKNTQGIYAHDAGLHVTAITRAEGDIVDAVIVKRSRFEGLTYGIYYDKSSVLITRNITSTARFESSNTQQNSCLLFRGWLYVTHSDFLNNVNGIFNTNANNSTICNNYFSPGNATGQIPMGLNTPCDAALTARLTQGEAERLEIHPIYGNLCSVGINLNASTGYSIRGNIFAQADTIQPYGVGIHVKGSGGSPNQITDNRFEFLRIGILSNGNNKAEYTNDGLQLLCNTFTEDCVYGIAVNTGNGIAQMQGSRDDPAGNHFPMREHTEGMDIQTYPLIPVYYYYDRNASDEMPRHITAPYIMPTPALFPANCGSSVIEETTPEKSARILGTAYTNLLYNYQHLLDGGSTPHLLTEWVLSWDKTAWEIRADLLAQSPYLSPELLLRVAEKGVLPQAMLLEVCLANPDATRQGELLYALRYRIPDPLPEYMCDLIEASWEQETFRTHLESSVASAALGLETASRQLIRGYLSDTVDLKDNPIDSIAGLLEVLPGREAVYELADLYAEAGNFALAFQKLEELNTRKLSEQESLEVQQMKEWFLFLERYVRKEKKPEEVPFSPDEVETLLGIAQQGGKAGERAKSALYHYAGCAYNYHVEPEFAGKCTPKPPQTRRDRQTIGEESQGKISVFPNPASEHATFDYEIEGAQEILLRIIDGKGSTVLSTALSGSRGRYLWDTSHLPSGIYTYSILISGEKPRVGKVVVKR